MDKPLSHQKIKQNKRKLVSKWVFVFVGLILLVFLLANSFTHSVNRLDIRTSVVSKKNLKTALSAGGTIVPISEETIASGIDSHLAKIYVQAGESVEQGQILIQLDTTKVQLALEEKDEQVALKRNKIETHKLNLNRTLNDKASELELLQVDLDSHLTKLNRLKQLSKTGGTSKHDLKEAELTLKRTQIQIRQLQQSIKDIEASSLAEIDGFLLELSILQKSRDEEQRQLENATVKSTAKGLVVWIKNEEGSAVTKGESLVRVADVSSYKLEATLSDFYANQLWQGMPAEFSYDSKKFTGQVQSIIASDQQGILKLTIALKKEQSKSSNLRQKQRVEVSLITGELTDVLLINKGPFINGAGLQKVFRLKDDKAIRQEIKIGAANLEYYQVTNGLKEGDEIIISDVATFAHLSSININ